MPKFSHRNLVSRSNLERLESRDQPASLLTGVVTGGVLTLTGDEMANVFVLKDTGTDIVVTGDANNQIRVGSSGTPASAQTFAGVNSIKLVLKAGDDSVTMDNTVPLNLSGSFTADMGSGNNTLDLTAVSAASSVGSLSYFGADGNDNLFVGKAGITTTVIGSLSFVGGQGISQAILTGTDVAGSMAFGGKNGIDLVSLDSATVIRKNLTVDFGGGSGPQSLMSSGAVIKGNVIVRGEQAEINLAASTTTTIEGTTGLTIDSGLYGDSACIVHGDMMIPNGGIFLTGKYGTSTLTADDLTSITLGKDLKVSNDSVSVTTSDFSVRNIALTSKFDANVGILAALTVSGKTTVRSASTLSSVMINGGISTLNGPVSVTGLTGADLIVLGGSQVTFGSSVTVFSSQASASFEANDSASLTVTGLLSVKGNVAGSLSFANSGENVLLKDVQISGTNGRAVAVAQGAKSTFSGNVKVQGRRLLAIFSPSAAGSSVNGNLTLSGGTGDDFIQINGGFNVLGNASFNGGADGALQLLLGDTGALTEFGSLSVSALGGVTNMVVKNLKVDGNTLVKTGSSGDVVAIDQSTFGGLFSFDSGDGDDQLKIEQNGTNSPTNFMGKATINLGAGSDRLALGLPAAALDKAIFSLTSTINGGTGINYYDDELGQGLTTANLSLLSFTDPTP